MQLVFLDFEASSLDSGTFPIEVAWAIDGGEAEAHLIRPASGWTEWSAGSERLHGITRARLQAEGRPHAEVALRTAEVLGWPETIVASDNAAFEAFWLEKLMQAASLPVPCIVRSARSLYMEAARGATDGGLGWDAAAALVTKVLEAERERPRIRHRARPDAEAMLWVLQEVRRRTGGGSRRMAELTNREALAWLLVDDAEGFPPAPPWILSNWVVTVPDHGCRSAAVRALKRRFDLDPGPGVADSETAHATAPCACSGASTPSR